ncbi:hypothetical protein [Sphaerisporangium aureirubrum]|uniref:Uncharacterized protein n=1 Tax=Sphaerisporangium aureirubrum TaxID=1544736 RepID=A0ABW1NNM2_9ACTN
MLGEFWTTTSGKLADRFVAASLPAVVFWWGGLLAWVFGRWSVDGLNEFAGWLDRQPAMVQLAVLLAALLTFGASAIVVRRLTRPVLRLLAGYWPRRPRLLARLRASRVERVQRTSTTSSSRFQELMNLKDKGTATSEQLAELVDNDNRSRRLPAPHRRMPTRVGNILRAAESRPVDKYGLDAVHLWPHLWLLLPDTARQELSMARTALNSAVNSGIWGVLFLLFAPWTLWAIPTGLAVTVAAWWQWLPARAAVFADLVETAYDLYRGALYEQVRWPLPTNPKQERAQGRLLTTYLMRGLDDDRPSFGPQQASPYTES